MNTTIVITSIFKPTEAVVRFSEIPDHVVIVVGDNKAPSDWECRNVRFVSVEEQKRLDFQLAGLLPYNHYCRKMIGYLLAIKSGADRIVDTDDDNVPKPGWSFPEFDGSFDCISENLGFINVYKLYTDKHIWPRGLPLRLILQKQNLSADLSKHAATIGIWQGLADGDPDVDAIYRLTDGALCNFSDRDPVVLGTGTISPFNTQNTLIRKELFALLYLPTYVTFRFTDILRGLVAQPIMWAAGYALGFTGASVVQERNPHDYFSDFLSELPMYQNCERVMDVVSGAVRAQNSIADNLYNSYNALLENDIVVGKEMSTLEAWLNDLAILPR